ncbi:tRNA threonylcarbamoyladenosine dehydratase [Roseateles sp. LKC17W]|uniref:ThiF family adenylyltransferase n=1 Tax=Pelomonas margarita TaxID=3299031 RepID=A0ABW7FFQ3_9BURK
MNAQDRAVVADDDADLERRFGGLRRLHGDAAYNSLRTARFAVVGLGGVGSWAAEALARSGVAELVLIDLDQVSESNINRQIQALGSTVGMAKAEASRLRVADIHPGCSVRVIEEFVDADNWPKLLGGAAVDGLIDCCDQVRAKAVLADWARQLELPFVTVGAAGGKREPHRVQLDDLSATTHDPLLASLRQRLRKQHGAPRVGTMGVACVYSKEPVHQPQRPEGEACEVDGSLNCHGYGSSVTVTATFGLCAAAELQRLHIARAASQGRK